MTGLKGRSRSEARRARADLSAEERRRASIRLGGWGGRHFSGDPPGCVALYWPIGDELDPVPLSLVLMALGWSPALPVTGARGTALKFRHWRPGDALVAGPFGTSEPAPAAPEAAPDLLLVPLLAFDSARNRLGYGGGFYDRTLASLRPSRHIRAVGIAFAAQRVAEVPIEPWDAPLDLILTERGIVC